MGKKTEWTEEKIQKRLHDDFLSFGSKKYELFGRFIYDWESDYWVVTKSGYAYECEIKISRGDYFNDAKKEQKHLILEGKEESYGRPNYFYYAVPEGLITPDEVPDNYGLIYVTETDVRIVRKASLIHKEKLNVEALRLTDKFYYLMLDYKWEARDVPEYKRIIRQLEKDNMELDNLLSEANGRIDEMKLERQKEEKDLKVLKEFCSKMKQEDMDPKIAEIVNDHFWEML